jgi:PAS domain S-box-containing protein
MSKGSARALHEVAKQERTQEMLREAEERFRSAFSYAVIGMALVGTDGRWLQVNRSLCEIVGYSEQELLSKTFQDITHPDDLEADLGYVHQLLSGEIRTYQMEKRYLHKLGHVVWVLLSVSLVRDNEGNPALLHLPDPGHHRAQTSRRGASCRHLAANRLV